MLSRTTPRLASLATRTLATLARIKPLRPIVRTPIRKPPVLNPLENPIKEENPINPETKSQPKDFLRSRAAAPKTLVKRKKLKAPTYRSSVTSTKTAITALADPMPAGITSIPGLAESKISQQELKEGNKLVSLMKRTDNEHITMYSMYYLNKLKEAFHASPNPVFREMILMYPIHGALDQLRSMQHTWHLDDSDLVLCRVNKNTNAYRVDFMVGSNPTSFFAVNSDAISPMREMDERQLAHALDDPAKPAAANRTANRSA